MLSKAQVASRPNVLWCYKKELGFSSHRQKRLKQLKKAKERGLLVDGPGASGKGGASDEPGDSAASDLDRFLTTTDIRYCYYKETDKILGNTYGMCVLQVSSACAR